MRRSRSALQYAVSSWEPRLEWMKSYIQHRPSQKHLKCFACLSSKFWWVHIQKPFPIAELVTPTQCQSRDSTWNQAHNLRRVGRIWEEIKEGKLWPEYSIWKKFFSIKKWKKEEEETEKKTTMRTTKMTTDILTKVGETRTLKKKKFNTLILCSKTPPGGTLHILLVDTLGPKETFDLFSKENTLVFYSNFLNIIATFTNDFFKLLLLRSLNIIYYVFLWDSPAFLDTNFVAITSKYTHKKNFVPL